MPRNVGRVPDSQKCISALGHRASSCGDTSFCLSNPTVFLRADISPIQKQRASKADCGQHQRQSRQRMKVQVFHSFSFLKKTAENTVAKLGGENRRNCIANLCELPCGRPKKNKIVGKSLQPCTFSCCHCAQMRNFKISILK